MYKSLIQNGGSAAAWLPRDRNLADIRNGFTENNIAAEDAVGWNLMQKSMNMVIEMVNQYLMIIGGSLLRFGFDINYVISKVFGDESFSSICPP